MICYRLHSQLRPGPTVLFNLITAFAPSKTSLGRASCQRGPGSLLRADIDAAKNLLRLQLAHGGYITPIEPVLGRCEILVARARCHEAMSIDNASCPTRTSRATVQGFACAPRSPIAGCHRQWCDIDRQSWRPQGSLRRSAPMMDNSPVPHTAHGSIPWHAER